MITVNRFYVIITGIALMSLSCSSDGGKRRSTDLDAKLSVELDTSSRVIKFENTLFSVPSPYQLSILVKEIGSAYNVELLNPTANQTRYNSLFKKAVNLGVYGADLAYLNIYEQSPSAISYFSVIKIMAQDLGLTAAFDANLFTRIENNIDNKDSLLYIISNAYRNIDMFLKENQRQREGALILAGGWVEATYFMTELALESKSKLLYQRVGENKQPLENLIKLLSPYYAESEELGKLVDSLIDLSAEFDAIETDYTYIEPEIIPGQQLCIVKSKSEVKVSQEVLTAVNSKVKKIRNGLIN